MVKSLEIKRKGLSQMFDITISKELARQFAYECFDEIVGAIQKANDEQHADDGQQQAA